MNGHFLGFFKREYIKDTKFKGGEFLKIFIFLSIIFFLIYIYYFELLSLKKKKKNIFLRKRLKFLKKYNIAYKESNLMTFQDKINWLIIHDTNKLKGNCSDKILLHEYSKKKLGKDICNKIIKIYNNVEEIKLSELPNTFIIKTNHASGFNIIVNNKSNFDFINTKLILNQWINIDYGDFMAEFHYSYIKKKIFVEEFLGEQLKNYKFLCYNGNPRFVYLSILEGEKKYRNFYDMNWNFINFHCLSEPHPTQNFSKPKNFELMKEYASRLSNDFIFVRVDFYELKDGIRLGELTFTPMNSFFYCKNKSHEIELGKEIKII